MVLLHAAGQCFFSIKEPKTNILISLSLFDAGIFF